MSTDPSDLAASRPQPGPEAPRGAESPYSPGSPGDQRRRRPRQEDPASQVPQQSRPASDSRPSDHGQGSPSPLPERRQSSPRPQRRGSQPGQPEPSPAETWDPPPIQARDIVRIFQCRLCSTPYTDAATLPCGRSICRSCLPETHARTSITYPALPNRMRAFRCPFPVCGREHVLDDCGADVILNKVASIVGSAMERYQAEAAELRLSTTITVGHSWPKAAIGLSARREQGTRSVSGTRLLATWTLAAEGELDFEADVAYPGFPSPPNSFTEYDARALAKMQQAMRAEMDCQICYALFHDPLTTGCGHTFCRPCLHRILDHSRYCPICRRRLAINPLLKPSSCPSNERVTSIIETFWKDEMMARQEAVAAEHAARHQDLDVPLFVCTLSFPMMPTFLHIFEPRYRLMIRRALEGNKTFGMVLPKRPRHSGDAHFHELGTLLRIINAHFYPDGRSLIETVGLSRFRVGRHGHLDGYTVGRTERIDDVSLEEEEAIEAAEVGYDSGVGMEQDHDSRHLAQGGNSGDTRAEDLIHGPEALQPGASPMLTPQPRESMPQTVADLDTMTTQSLMRFAVGFVARMREQGVPWLTERMLAIYGPCPEDPAVFPWWFASTLPVKDHEKYRLLETSSVRDRLKICGSWIVEMETVPWSLNSCAIL